VARRGDRSTPSSKKSRRNPVSRTVGIAAKRLTKSRWSTTPDPTFGWGTLAAGGVEVHEVPGDHYWMVREPQVRTLAERIRAGLDESVVRLSAGFGDNAPGAGERRAIGSAD